MESLKNLRENAVSALGFSVFSGLVFVITVAQQPLTYALSVAALVVAAFVAISAGVTINAGLKYLEAVALQLHGTKGKPKG